MPKTFRGGGGGAYSRIYFLFKSRWPITEGGGLVGLIT